MGYGDQLMATGMARGARARGRRIAFGDRNRILWDKHSETVFVRNPNIAKPGSERDADLEWVEYFKGRRIYNRQDAAAQRWIWNLEFQATPGEVFFDAAELRNARRYGEDFVVIEPNLPWWKSVAPNKDWGSDRYQQVADLLRDAGWRVVQFVHDKAPVRLRGVEALNTLGFRDGLGILKRAALYVGPEGGLHHAAAAVETPGVVLFGGFIPPSVTGYASHANLTGGAVACGSYVPCRHCADAMRAISVEQVFNAAMERL